MERVAEALWYSNRLIPWLLSPFSLIYKVCYTLRRLFLQRFKQAHFSVPIVIVGNLTVGGVGKTPLVIALAQEFCRKGLRVGIVSRGYGAKIRQFPHEISAQDSAVLVGDEPFMLAKKTGCPVVIAPKRVQAVQYLLEHHASQIIISDDGLQHYAMGRSIEIVVMDGLRQLGNGFCLPAGPLRESARRLKKSDFLVVTEGELPNSYSMRLQPMPLVHMKSGDRWNVSQLETPIAAVAGIGHPQRFFTTLQNLGLRIIKYPFPDHHFFKKNDLQFQEKTVVMTEKDAVKCHSFAEDSWYFLPVEAKLNDSFWHALWSHEQLKGYI